MFTSLVLREVEVVPACVKPVPSSVRLALCISAGRLLVLCGVSAPEPFRVGWLVACVARCDTEDGLPPFGAGHQPRRSGSLPRFALCELVRAGTRCLPHTPSPRQLVHSVRGDPAGVLAKRARASTVYSVRPSPRIQPDPVRVCICGPLPLPAGGPICGYPSVAIFGSDRGQGSSRG